MHNYQNLAQDLVQKALRRGADDADVYISEGRSLSIQFRLGRIEKLEEAMSEGLGIRVFQQGAAAQAYSTDLSADSLERLLEDTLRLVAVIDRDPYNGLPPAQLLGSIDHDLQLWDDSIELIAPETKLDIVKEVEESGLAQDGRINNSNGAWWDDGAYRITLANSRGFNNSYHYTSCGFGVALVAEENGVKQTDAWWSSSRAFDRLDSAASVGQQAAHRTLRKLGARSMPTQTVPVVFDPMTGADFLKILFQALNGSSIYRRHSFLVDKIDQVIGNANLNIIDDSTMVAGLASRPFDAEGVRSARTELIREGRVKNYLCDAYSASRLNRLPTGHASRSYSSGPSVNATNLYLEPGQTPPEDIICSVKAGFYVTRLYWVGINQSTGDYSRGAEGLWIVDGELAHSVQEVTIAGNMLDMMKRIEVIGNDLEFRSSIACPTFLVSDMVISGR